MQFAGPAMRLFVVPVFVVVVAVVVVVGGKVGNNVSEDKGSAQPRQSSPVPEIARLAAQLIVVVTRG